MDTAPSTLQRLNNVFGPEQFGLIQLFLLLLVFFWLIRFFQRNSRESNFRTDSFQSRSSKKNAADRDKQQEREKMRHLLGGFVFTGQPHEILGVPRDATEFEIRRAHRALIKRFHPDKVGRQDSREWHEAQKIAESLNTARDQMLQNLKNHR